MDTEDIQLDSQTFRPTLDWGREFLHSMQWVATTFVLTALALLVIISVWTYGIREKGVKGYFKHFVEPYPILAPLNILEELIKPLTLALRLFGNIFAGGILVALIAMFPWYIQWLPNAVWKTFDLFVGLIQAFIFSLLTILYFSQSMELDHDEH